MLSIQPIPAFNDNYIWMIGSGASPSVVVVDPGEAFQVQRVLELQRRNLAAILLTHHHGDHVGGVHELLEAFPVPVYGPEAEAIDAVDHPVHEGTKVAVEELQLRLDVLDVPGHTAGHVAYRTEHVAFVGDTLFAGGCGRIFEGTPEQMFRSLEKLTQLPANTSIYCAHEYTLANLRFALAVEPDNPQLHQRLQAMQQIRGEGLPTIPAPLADELATNPFLRCNEPDVISAAEEHVGHGVSTAVEVFTVIREWKDGWRG